MSDKRKPTMRRLMFRSMVLMSMVATKAFAGFAPFVTNSNGDVDSAGWKQAGRDLSGGQTVYGLDQDIIYMVQTPIYGKDLESVIRLSFAMARVSDFDELDALWVRTLTERSGSDAVALFLDVRSQIVVQEQVAGAERFGETWLWRATTGAGDS